VYVYISGNAEGAVMQTDIEYMDTLAESLAMEAALRARGILIGEMTDDPLAMSEEAILAQSSDMADALEALEEAGTWKEILERKKEILAQWERDEEESGVYTSPRVRIEGNRAWIDGELVFTLGPYGEVYAEMPDEPNMQMRIGVCDRGTFRQWVVGGLLEGELDSYLPSPKNGDASEGE
jgi:hypothetical protein